MTSDLDKHKARQASAGIRGRAVAAKSSPETRSLNKEDPLMTRLKFKMRKFTKASVRRDIALYRLHEYYTAPAAQRDKIDAAHPDGDAYNSLVDEVCLAHMAYMFARG